MIDLLEIKMIEKIGEFAGDNTIITTDVGQHQMWTAQNYTFSKPKQFLTSAGLGTMGFGLPAAIGTASQFEFKTDYTKIAQGFGIKGIQLNKCENSMDILRDFIIEKGSGLIDIQIETSENVYPTVKPGKSNIEMIEA